MTVGQHCEAVCAHALLCWKASLIRDFLGFFPWYFTALTLTDPRRRWFPKDTAQGTATPARRKGSTNLA